MLNWLMKKAARSFLTAQKAVQQEEAVKDAYKLGQDAAKSTVEQLDAYLGERREQLNTTSFVVTWMNFGKRSQ